MSDTKAQKKTSLFGIALGLLVAGIFSATTISFQVNDTEKAVVMTLGQISSVAGPGLHFKWPMPFQITVKYDVRLRCYDGNAGKLEEVATSDQKNVVVGIYAVYKIEDLAKFHSSGGDIALAEDRLGALMRTAKNGAIGMYGFDELVNLNSGKVKLLELERRILDRLVPEAMSSYGIKVVSVGVKSLVVPEKVAKSMATRMISERKVASTRYREDGKAKAADIKTEAESQKLKTLADAEAKSKEIRAEGDAEAALHYEAFSQNPGLAIFLRKIESLKKVISSKTILMLDTDSAPFDVMGKERLKEDTKLRSPGQ